jgi:hypothetical protein
LSELRDPVEKDKVFMANLVYTYVWFCIKLAGLENMP